MTQRLSIQLFIALVAIAAFLSGCQQGKRKDSEVLVYSDGLARCEKIEMALHAHAVDVTGISEFKGKPVEPTLPANLKKLTVETQTTQELLEEYILVARQLLVLGDTRAVIFPEKNRIQSGLERASKYLGQIYAEKKWFGEPNPVQTREVDNAEFSARFKRSSEILKEFNSQGLDYTTLEDLQKVDKIMAKKTPKQLRTLKLANDKFGEDLMRQKVLLSRNNNFDMLGLDKWAAAVEPIAGFYYRITDAANKEHKRKTGKPIGP
jgi:hypothetical protein